MAWIPPKTNWRALPRDRYGRWTGEWFKRDPDFIRIKGNLEYLVQRVSSAFTIIAPPVIPLPAANGLVYENELNAIEQNIDSIKAGLPYPISLPATKTWYGDGKGPTIDDLNRWETSCLILEEAIRKQAVPVYKIPFKMNGRRF